MAAIETKFGIGDVVWFASTTTETRQHPCPDCLGSRSWEARSPAGGEFTFSCPRCSANYSANHELNLKYSWWIPSARRLTIGQVRAFAGSSAGPREQNEYMCLETGVGSGSLYREDRLFATEAEALACAQTMANVENANPLGWVAKQFNQSLAVSDYQLKEAEERAAIDAAKRAQWRVGYLVEDLESAEDLDEVKELIQRWRDRDDNELRAIAKAED